MPYATLLLDLDHTLFDSDASEALAFAQALATVGVDQPARYFPTYDAINRGLWAAVERGELPTAAAALDRIRRLVVLNLALGALTIAVATLGRLLN